MAFKLATHVIFPRQARVRAGLIGLAVVFLLAGCIGGDRTRAIPPPLPHDRIRLETSVRTQYYAVRGTTTGAIFDYMERNGPIEDTGQRVHGLASAQSSFVWTKSTGHGACSIAAMTMTLNLVVTLPRHEDAASLAPPIRTKWENFVASVAAHEQHHVDIYLDGAKMTQAQMEGIPPLASCGVLDRAVASVNSAQQRLVNSRQERFHEEEKARLDERRGPLQAQLDANRARLASASGQVQALDDTGQSLNSETVGVEAQLRTLKGELESIAAPYPKGLPPAAYAKYEAVRARYNAAVLRLNSVVEQYNVTTARRNALVAEVNGIVSATNALIETLNWTK